MHKDSNIYFCVNKDKIFEPGISEKALSARVHKGTNFRKKEIGNNGARHNKGKKERKIEREKERKGEREKVRKTN